MTNALADFPFSQFSNRYEGSNLASDQETISIKRTLISTI